MRCKGSLIGYVNVPLDIYIDTIDRYEANPRALSIRRRLVDSTQTQHTQLASKASSNTKTAQFSVFIVGVFSSFFNIQR